MIGDLLLFHRENDKLRSIIKDLQWMARRYAHGRMSYAVGMYNHAVKEAEALGIEFRPDPIDGLIEAKDGMLDREWFESNGKLWEAANREASVDVLRESDELTKRIAELEADNQEGCVERDGLRARIAELEQQLEDSKKAVDLNYKRWQEVAQKFVQSDKRVLELEAEVAEHKRRRQKAEDKNATEVDAKVKATMRAIEADARIRELEAAIEKALYNDSYGSVDCEKPELLLRAALQKTTATCSSEPKPRLSDLDVNDVNEQLARATERIKQLEVHLASSDYELNVANTRVEELEEVNRDLAKTVQERGRCIDLEQRRVRELEEENERKQEEAVKLASEKLFTK